LIKTFVYFYISNNMVHMLSTFAASVLVAFSVISSVTAHGYMSSPPVRGIEKESYSVDSLKAPNWSGRLCRGEPAGKITNIGSTVTLGFTITAPHVGMCTVYILDANLGNPQKIAEKLDCAAPGKVGPWTINIPSNITGRKVIRWYWEAAHVTPHEPYENCADIIIGGNGSGPQPGYTGTTTTTTTATVSAMTTAPVTMAKPGVVIKSSKPTTRYPTAPVSAPSSSDSNNSSSGASAGSCQSGQYTCDSNGRLGQCSYGSYTWFSCSKGTTCRNSGSYYYCGH
jgi:predicted carbohydrate-binding protein with CBM5 and CBM33 domain